MPGEDDFSKGDILIGRVTVHPIVFLKRETDDQFIGCIITHSTSKRYPDNIGLKPEHFIDRDSTGKNYKIIYDRSYFVGFNTVKKNDWGPFKKVGRLTIAGIEFIESYLTKTEPTLWRNYMENRNTI